MTMNEKMRSIATGTFHPIALIILNPDTLYPFHHVRHNLIIRRYYWPKNPGHWKKVRHSLFRENELFSIASFHFQNGFYRRERSDFFWGGDIPESHRLENLAYHRWTYRKSNKWAIWKRQWPLMSVSVSKPIIGRFDPAKAILNPCSSGPTRPCDLCVST